MALEHERLESQLIIQAIQTGDTKQAATNLNFLLTIGLLPDTSRKLKAYLDSGLAGPVLPAPSTPVVQQKTGLAMGDTVMVHVTTPYEAEVSWYRKQWVNTPGFDSLLKRVGVLSSGTSAFPIPYGGTIYVRVKRAHSQAPPIDKMVDCTKAVTCRVRFP